MNSYIARTLIALSSLALLPLALAATFFVPEDQPIGYLAPVASSDLEVGVDTFVYVPKLALDTMSGDLVAARLSASGAVSLLSPKWLF